MKLGLYGTFLQTRDGKVYRRGYEYPPRHDHPRAGLCDECAVVNAEPRLVVAER